MPEAQIAQAVQLLDLMLEHFADDGHWARGRYDDGNGGHCLVGALLHLSRKHRLPRAAAIALLQVAAMPPNCVPSSSRPDASSMIMRSKDRAAAAAKAWLLAQIGKKRSASRDITDIAPKPFAPERLAA